MTFPRVRAESLRAPPGLLFAAACLAACGGEPRTAPAPEISAGQILGQAWADNWFAMYLGDELVVEDSVPITSERSFNQETFVFEASLPAVAAFVLKDFKENDSGLEYIGSRRQQMGDGGFIAQFTTADGELVGVSDGSWRCLTIHEAPLDKACESSDDPSADCVAEIGVEPEGWRQPDFDDSGWPLATEWSRGDVSPKHGYDEIDWRPTAKLIWGADLETHNTLLCRATLALGSSAAENADGG